jgi:universal stress protein A
MFAPKKILVPTDFSKFSDSALAEAMDMARQYKSIIYLLHVVGVVEQDYNLPGKMWEGLRRRFVKSAKEIMEQQVKRSGKTKDIEIVMEIRDGTPVYGVILKQQEAKGVDLIVIAPSGKTGLYHLGSVADKVTRDATCPVYLVKGPKR